MNVKNLYILRIICCIFFALFYSCVYAKTIHQINKDLNKIIKPFESNMHIGIRIQSMKSQKIIYERNPKRLFIPASTMKLFTHATALSYLGSDFKFITKLSTAKKNLQSPTFNGNLYLTLSGDPTLKINHINNLIKSLSEKGIKKIHGNIYIDNTIFSGNDYGPGWMWDELNICYAGPINGSIINKNCQLAKIYPAKQIGKKARIRKLSKHFLFKISNKVITVSDKKDCSPDLTTKKNNSYTISGCINKSKTPFLLEIAATDLHDFDNKIIRDLLAANHIKFYGRIQWGKTPKNIRIIAKHQSQPLYILLETMSKNSDNIIAGSVFKTIGSHYSHQTGTWKRGENAFYNILNKELKLPLTNAVIVDGSGLSRYNQLSPTHLSNLLNAVYHNFRISSEFQAGLPIVGIDKSVHGEMNNRKIKYKYRAKTGSMTGVRGLAGYVETNRKEVLSFVIFLNGLNANSKKYLQLEKAICEYLVKYV